MSHPFIYFLIVSSFVNTNFCKTENSLPHLLINRPENDFFKKFSLCSLASSNIKYAYDLEGKIIESVLTGFEIVAQDREDSKKFQKYQDHDSEIKKLMYEILHEREVEKDRNMSTSNPIFVLQFFIRVSTRINPELNKIFASDYLMKRTFHQDLRAAIERMIKGESSCWPSLEDVIVTIHGLIDISETYKINKVDILNGKISKSGNATDKIEFDVAMAIIQEVNRQGLFEEVIDWIKALEILYSDQINKFEYSWRGIARMKSKALIELNEKSKAIESLEKSIKEAKYDVKTLKKDLKYFQNLSENKNFEKNKELRQNKTKIAHLCSGDFANLNSVDGSLKCFYKKQLKGWARTQVELLSRTPFVLKYHKLVKNEQILELFDHIKTHKVRSHEYGYNTQFIIDKSNRKEEAIVWNDENIEARHLSDKIGVVTQLETGNFKHNTRESGSGPFYVTNYGVGGHSNNNQISEKSNFPGNRMSTWIYLLTDSFEGGKVIFPQVNLTVSMEKGSGILWHNLFKNGTVNPNAEYMECPVISGSKWTARKYIYEYPNMFHRKCSKKRRAYF